jgi:hypothetical protein
MSLKPCCWFGEGKGQCTLKAGHDGPHKFACNCGYKIRLRGWFPLPDHKPNCASAHADPYP